MVTLVLILSHQRTVSFSSAVSLVSMSVCPSVCLSLLLSVSASLSISPPLSLSLSLSHGHTHTQTHTHTHTFSLSLSLSLSPPLSLSLSLSLSLCLSFNFSPLSFWRGGGVEGTPQSNCLTLLFIVSYYFILSYLNSLFLRYIWA